MKTAPTLLTIAILCCAGADLARAAGPEAQPTRAATAGQHLRQRLSCAGKSLCRVVKRVDRATGFAKLRRRLGNRLSLAGAYGTELADKLQAHLPGALGRGFGKLRLFSLGTAGAFAAKKFKQDAGFLATFGVVSPTLMHTAVPVAIAAGANPMLVGLGHEILEIPLNLGVIAWRQHKLAKRQNPNQTFGQTMRQLGREYQTTAVETRARNHRRLQLHRHFKAKRHAATARAAQQPSSASLHHLGAQLATP